MYLEAIKGYYKLINIVPPSLITEDMCIASIEQSNYGIMFIPKKLFTKRISDIIQKMYNK